MATVKLDAEQEPDYDQVDPDYDLGADPDYDEGSQDASYEVSDPDADDGGSQEWRLRSQK
jgi:hypothetical protein